MQHTQHLIIGFGKAGKTLSASLSKAGQSVILVEQSAKMYGGTCINIGCIPSKKLAFLSYMNREKSDLESAIEKKNALISKLNQANYKKFSEKTTIITGKASFIDAHTVNISKDDGSNITITADNIYINTGAKNWQAPIDGVQNSSYVYDSTSLMQLKTKPEHLVIIGGGYIGLEFAFTFAGFGSKVTILETSDTFVAREDRQIADNLLKIMKNKDINVKLAQQINYVSDENNEAIINTKDGEISCDAILIATGRRANTEELNLDKANVKLTERGFIEVNKKLQTSQPHIYAMGDVAGSPQFTYMSLDDYRVVKSQVLGTGDYTTENRQFSYAVFTNPPLANAGLTEQMAKEQGYKVKTAILEAVNIPKAKILEETDGLLKAVVDSETDKILGVQLLCAEAHEMINFMDLAIKQGLRYQQVRDYIFTHPTMSEALNDLFSLID
ncbi:MAG: FAD-dependent oxidoreductase [Moraxellaceae bacterium]|nr:FAD-dependent oxidoreductase [Moraxellaceae bacterium]